MIDMTFLREFNPQRSRFCSVDPFTMMAGSTALEAGSSIFSGIMGKSAAKKQAEAIRLAQEKARGAVEKYTDQAKGELRSFRERGDTAGGMLADLISGKLDPNAVLKASSLFKFQEQEGSTAINRELKARGLYGSGAGLESLRKFENQLVGEEGQRQYDRLFQLSEQGRMAGAQIAGLDSAAGGQIAEIEMKGGAARGNALAGGDQALTEGISGALKSVGSGGMQYMSYKMLEPILAKLGGSTDGPMGNGVMQEALGNSIVSASSDQWHQSQINNAGMTEGVSWASNPY